MKGCRDGSRPWVLEYDQGFDAAVALIAEWLRKPNEDGAPCSAEREMLAQRIERGEHLK